MNFCKTALIAVLSIASSGAVADWPAWRGPDDTGAAPEDAVVTSWSLEGDNLLWKVPIGGRSTPVIHQGRAFFIAAAGDNECLQERVTCLDINTGKLVWEHPFNVTLSSIVANRIGWTSMVADTETGYVYAHLINGELVCFDRDGKLIWKREMTEEFSRVSGYGGRVMNPMIDEDRVIVSFLNSGWGNQGKPTHRYVAFDKRTGDILWWAAPGGAPLDTTYSTPITAVINNQRLLIAGTADGAIYAMQARTGKTVWSFQLSKRGINVSLVADGTRIYACHSEENLDSSAMGRIVCIDGTKTGDITHTGELWRIDGCGVGYSTPSILDGRLYVIDNAANMFCLDAATGKQHWEHKLGRAMKGSPVITRDKVIYIGESNGVFHILKDEGSECRPLDEKEFKRDDGAIDEIFGAPTVCDGRVYFMTRYNTYCLGRKDVTPNKFDPVALAVEKPDTDNAIAQLFVVPGELTLKPGQSQPFHVLAYNKSGRRVTENVPAAKWSADGVPGTFSQDGTFNVAPDKAFAAGLITAECGNVKAAARVRVSPPPPYTIDFENFPIGKVPPGWVGFNTKTTVFDLNGNKVLRKIGPKEMPSPPIMRLTGFFGPTMTGGYTLQADLFAAEKKTRFVSYSPDMGVTLGRYELTLIANPRELELARWRDEPRYTMRKRMPLEWKPETWYRVKLSFEPNGAQATVRGKVWPAAESEPDAWTIEFVDPCANTEGSAGLVANSNGTTSKSDGPDAYFDNIQVTPND